MMELYYDDFAEGSLTFVNVDWQQENEMDHEGQRVLEHNWNVVLLQHHFKRLVSLVERPESGQGAPLLAKRCRRHGVHVDSQHVHQWCCDISWSQLKVKSHL